MREALRTIWNEPAAKNPPPPQRWDWILVAVILVGAIAEAVFREIPWKGAHLTYTILIALALPWRRLYPGRIVGGAFALVLVVEFATSLIGNEGDGIYTGAFMLMLPYALLRWGSGRDELTVLPIMLAFPWISFGAGSVDLPESIVGTVFLMFPAAIGASVCYRIDNREREIEQVRLHEREQLARELHDTVAHHVSAIAIQAQAGRAVAETDPSAAVKALDVIEEAASQTLSDMRAMVGVLRRGEPAELTPQAGVADIVRLANAEQKPTIKVHLEGNLDDLPPTVEAGLYRLAQESVTNARRHAHQASRVNVRVVGSADQVELEVTDDGMSSAGPDHRSQGFGIAGMTERAKLLGGSLEAGPADGRGWTVTAVLPRNGESK